MLLHFVVDDLIYGGYNIGLHVGVLFLLFQIALDNTALLQQFLIIFVEFIVQSSNNLLPFLELLHEVLNFRLEAIPNDFVDVF
jgi:hypothetical protein